MQAVEPKAIDPTPPGAKVRYDWSGFPYWFLGIVAVIAFPAFKILTDESWREGYLFIRDGMTVTIIVTVFGFILSMALGLVISLGRMSKNVFARNLAIFYIELIRGIPVLVTIFFVGLVAWPALVRAIGISGRGGLASPARR